MNESDERCIKHLSELANVKVCGRIRGKEVGWGTFGIVSLETLLFKDKECSMIWKTNYIIDTDILKIVQNEIKASMYVRLLSNVCPNLVQMFYHYICPSTMTVHLLLEYADKGDLVKNSKEIYNNYDQFLSYIAQTMFAMGSIHFYLNSSHNDIKPDNVLLSKTNLTSIIYNIGNNFYEVPTHGILIKLADFSHFITIPEDQNKLQCEAFFGDYENLFTTLKIHETLTSSSEDSKNDTNYEILENLYSIYYDLYHKIKTKTYTSLQLLSEFFKAFSAWKIDPENKENKETHYMFNSDYKVKIQQHIQDDKLQEIISVSTEVLNNMSKKAEKIDQSIKEVVKFLDDMTTTSINQELVELITCIAVAYDYHRFWIIPTKGFIGKLKFHKLKENYEPKENYEQELINHIKNEFPSLKEKEKKDRLKSYKEYSELYQL